MIWSQVVLSDREHPSKQQLGFLVFALAVVEGHEVVEAVRGVRMQRAKLLLPDGKSTLIEGLSLYIFPLMLRERQEYWYPERCQDVSGPAWSHSS